MVRVFFFEPITRRTKQNQSKLQLPPSLNWKPTYIAALLLQEAAADMTRIQAEKNASIQRLQQLLNSKEHEVQVQFEGSQEIQ